MRSGILSPTQKQPSRTRFFQCAFRYRGWRKQRENEGDSSNIAKRLKWPLKGTACLQGGLRTTLTPFRCCSGFEKYMHPSTDAFFCVCANQPPLSGLFFHKRIASESRIKSQSLWLRGCVLVYLYLNFSWLIMDLFWHCSWKVGGRICYVAFIKLLASLCPRTCAHFIVMRCFGEHC